MDYSNGLGISFGTNYSEFEERDGSYEEAIESDNHRQVHNGQQMEDSGETHYSPTKLFLPNQFTPINQISSGAQAQSYGQPYQHSQPSTSFHPLENNGHLQDHMNAILASHNDYGQPIPQALQFGADPQFNNHGHPDYGFQNMSDQTRMDTQHGFGNSDMRPQQFTQNINRQYVSPAVMQHQEDPTHSPSNNLQTYRNLYRNQEDFTKVSDCLSFQPKPGSLRPSRFRPVHDNTSQVRNQLGDQVQSSSSARQGNISNKNNRTSGRAPGKKGGSAEERYWNGFDTHRSMWSVQCHIIENILPGSCISHLTPGEQEGVITMMQRLGLDKWKITCNEDIQKFLDQIESFKSHLYAKQARLRAEAGLPELPPPEEYQNLQGGDDPPLQDTSSFPEVSPNYVLTSDHGGPIFGQDPRDYRLARNKRSLQVTSLPAQEFNSQIRPPPLITQRFLPPTFQSHYGMQNQQGHPLVHPSDLLHPSMDQGMDRPLDFSYQPVEFNGGPPQQYHHHGQPFEYSSFHGHSPRSLHLYPSNNADQNFHPAPPPETIEEYEEDDEQQEEVTGTESQSQTAKQEYGPKKEQNQEQSEPPQQENQTAESESELDSDGWSIHADEMRSPPSNIYSIPDPQICHPHLHDHHIVFRNRVWSTALGAIDENGVIRDWDKAERREIVEGNCGCKGWFHGNGRDFIMWMVAGRGFVVMGEKGRMLGGSGEEGDDEDNAEDEGEEDEQLRGVPKGLSRPLTHGPELDKVEERRKKWKEDLDEGSPVKKWKGKGRAAESDEELDEQEVC
ncbi:uncharacterized protein EAF02_007275 [Botrytis sinoallii]|uniref:uncharacterized protein n=1 Tax=Botrytis sinoallii TaxID=1463999 RepID=UPI00190106CB|nr:uncharacterized protein EAF02_007275 [Botrytis sinoallii]KAF7880429.1 hypothetical protein EAF02_007275 [Botrytis sinoallii]